jgi:hypothetical protein
MSAFVAIGRQALGYSRIVGSSGMGQPMDVWLTPPSNLEVSAPITSGLEPAKDFGSTLIFRGTMWIRMTPPRFAFRPTKQHRMATTSGRKFLLSS